MRFDGANDGIDGRFCFSLPSRRRVVVIAKTVVPMKPLRAAMRALQRLFRAGKDGRARSAKFRGKESISSGLWQRNIARDGGNRQDLNLRIAQCHDQRDSIIRSCIGIN